jgi:beta-glucosidase
VRNTGSRRSREVVQVYLRPVEPDQPVRLVGWAGVDVGAGETAQVPVHGDPRVLRRWDAAGGGWRPLSPDGELLVARGLGDVRFRLPGGAR